MALARRWSGMVGIAAAATIGAALQLCTGCGPVHDKSVPEPGAAAVEAATVREPGPGRAIRGYVDPVPAVDGWPKGWRVRGTPLVYDERGSSCNAAVDASGAFALSGLEDVDYRVELVRGDGRIVVLASTDHVRPGGDELVLTIDPLALERLRELSAFPVTAQE